MGAIGARGVPPRHPLTRVGRVYIGLGVGVGVLTSLFVVATASDLVPPLAVLEGGCFALGGALLWNGWALLRLGQITPYVTAAANELSRGHLDAALAIHGSMPAALLEHPTARRQVGVQRAMIALLRGDPRAAVGHASAALSDKTTPFTKGLDLAHRIDALALRALAHAACGDARAASEDAAGVEASPMARGQALGRAALARAVLLARADDRPALASFLEENEKLVLEHGTRRERALLRALRALGRSSGKSIYREPVQPGRDPGAPLRAWAAAVVPQAGDFMPEHESFVAAPQVEPQIDPAAIPFIARSRVAANRSGGARRGPGWTLLLWGVLVVMFLALWQFLSPTEVTVHRPPTAQAELPMPHAELAPPPPSLLESLTMPVVVVLVGLGLVALLIARHNRLVRKLYGGERALARGRNDEALEILERLAHARRSPSIAALARLRLASFFARSGDFLRAIQEVDQGLAAVANGPRSVSADNGIPGLLAERAFALTVFDRHAEAETELAHMLAQAPTYVLGDSAVFRVRLLRALRTGNMVDAARLATSRTPDLSLDLPSDLLADVTLVATGGGDADLRDRVLADLAVMPHVRGWIHAVAGVSAPRLAI